MICPWCGGPATSARGVYLRLLYRNQPFCDACGRRGIHCTCRPKR